MDDFGKYDWAIYIIKDLWKEMGDYVKGYRRGNEGQGSSTVGGCIYLLLTDEKIKELASKERKSVRGIMYGGKGSEAMTGKEERIIVEFLDPELKKLRKRLMKRIEEGQKILMKMVDEELVKVQIPRQGDGGKGKSRGKARVETVPTNRSDSEDDEEERRNNDDTTEEKEKDEVSSEDGDSHGKGDTENDSDNEEMEEEGQGDGDDRSEGEREYKGDAKGDIPTANPPREVSPTIEGDEAKGHSPMEVSPLAIVEYVGPDPKPVSVEAQQLRRSTRVRFSKIKSPWLELKAQSRVKRPMKPKDIFFNLVSRAVKGDEGEM
ncbi:neurofilament medium polypeptide-like [Neltuma alba]|uniref:neurofilament medium polypeptide-like n=1 Tax=Neltuma alba TaxID=207710 RepID=UPI0010A4F74A|nr:neurofilament medium polypeptide-like [Prosopis alba]